MDPDIYVGLEEHLWRRRAWQVSQTLTGLGEAGSGSSLSEQLLQKISPQFLQWCWKQKKCITYQNTVAVKMTNVKCFF